jgi:hypothetical protein
VEVNVKAWWALGAAVGVSAWFASVAVSPEARFPPQPTDPAQAPQGASEAAPITSAAKDSVVWKNWRRPQRVGQARGWAASLEAFHRLRLGGDHHKRLRHLTRQYTESDDGVVRQNLIFLVALALPWDLARPWLTERWEDDPTSSAADRLDLEAALAMSGETEALASYEARALRPRCGPPAPLVDTIEDHERLCLAGARERLRAYRALEVVDRVAYFKRTAIEVHVRWFPHPRAERGEARLGQVWLNAKRSAPVGLQQRLFRAWLSRNDHHPGADDVALRIARHHDGLKEYTRAARWYARATLLPDQDVTSSALSDLLGIAELRLNDAELDDLVDWAESQRCNAGLLRYVRLRRHAANEGVAAGCARAEALCVERPQSLLARAWRARWAEPPARGLTSGIAPLSTADALRLTQGERIGSQDSAEIRAHGVPGVFNGWYSSGGQSTPMGRTDPWREAVALSPQRLARQFRLWSTLAELERRGSADDVYKQGALFYAEPQALFPVYARVTSLGAFSLPWYPSGERQSWRAAMTRFDANSRSHLLAAAFFTQVADEHPDWEGHDRALFSAGLSWRQLLRRECWDERRDRRAAVRELAACFERLCAEHPQSRFSDDAQRALTFWRTSYAWAFK